MSIVRNWLKSLNQLILRQSRTRELRKGKRQRTNTLRLDLEPLESRLTPSNLDLINGVLTYQGAAAETNLLSVSVANSLYSLTDPGAAITLGSGAKSAGWTLSNNNHTAQGLDSTLSSIAINLAHHNDTVNVQSINRPTVLSLGNGINTINVNSNGPLNTGTLEGITAVLRQPFKISPQLCHRYRC